MFYLKIITAVFVLGIASVSAFAGAPDEDASRVAEWLDTGGIKYIRSEFGGFSLAFEGSEVDRVDLQIDFSEDFIHFSAPVGYLPEPVGEGYLFNIISLTGSAPMLKPVIDEERFFYLTIDLPRAALSEAEVFSDLALLVDFIDAHHAVLIPETEDE